MIVLDTNVVSELMRPNPSAAVVAWVDRQAQSTLFLTTLSLAEIRYGIAALPAGSRRVGLDQVFEDQIRPLFDDRVLDFDERASREFAHLRADARARGAAIADVDALIAAVARVHQFDVATRDTAAFEAAGLRVINPFEAA